MPQWNLVRFIVTPILKGLNLSFSQVAYVNLVKWRTRNERMSAGLVRRSWELHTQPQLDLLRPSAVICLGQATQNELHRVADELPFNKTIPRVRRDCYSPPAQRQAIRAAIRSLKSRV
jgi:uracil-DNA glycosylase